jgi:DNA processing protein
VSAPDLHDDELAAWLRLTHSVGRESARRLLAAFASPQGVFAASAAGQRAVVGAALSDPPAGLDELIERSLAWRREGAGRHVVTLGDAAYPAALLQTADPPLLLYAQGRLELLQRPALAIVGSRNPTPQGADNARAFALHLARSGYTIVSGLALGIDGAAHEGALAAAGGGAKSAAGGDASTIAVVGTGIDRVYPSRHRELAHRIAEQGLLLSEFDLGTPPLAANFPMRNRLIAGLAQGTLVVEAALASGSLITARCAAEAGREVFALPGSIHSPQSRGCHALIKQGAQLVESADDILAELQPAAPALSAPGASAGDGDPLLAALGHDPATLDALVARCGWPPEQLAARLLELELDGLVARLPGGLYQRRQIA